MSPTTRRTFLTLASGSAVALSLETADLKGEQLPGQPPSQNSGSQDKNFSNVMAIAAHPGDAFFAMGAPVAVATHLGGQGSLLSLSLGEKGSPTIPTEQYGAMQREAAKKAAAIIGAKALSLTYPDGEIPINEEAKFTVCDLIRQYKPLTIVTHWKGSWHKDHRACYDILDDAIFYAGLPSLVRKEPAHGVTRVFYADNWEDATGFTAGHNCRFRKFDECLQRLPHVAWGNGIPLQRLLWQPGNCARLFEQFSSRGSTDVSRGTAGPAHSHAVKKCPVISRCSSENTGL